MNLRRNNTESCLSDGTLRSAVDNGVDRLPEVELHLQACTRCRQRLETISDTATYVDGKLASLVNNDVDGDSEAARLKLRRRINAAGAQDYQNQGDSFVSNMWKYRAARGVVALMALMLIATAFVATPMRSLADDLFNRFEVEKFEAVTIQPDQFGEFQAELMLRAFTADHERVLGALDELAEVETTFDQDNLESNVVKLDDVDAARDAFGTFKLPADLPEGYDTAPELMMSNGGTMSAVLNTASVKTILEELDLEFDSIPDPADMPTMEFEVTVPSALVSYYGAGSDGHLALVQMESPTLTTPEGVDMNALRDDVLSLPGLPEDFVSQVRAIDDWQNTLIVPVPEGAETRDVTIDGAPGLLLEAGEFDGAAWGLDLDFDIEGDLSVVMWNEDGVLYIVAGTLNGDDLLDVAGSLR